MQIGRGPSEGNTRTQGITDELPAARAQTQSPRNVHNLRTVMSGCAREWLSLTCPTD